MAPKVRRPAAAARPDRRRRGVLRPAAHHEDVGAAGEGALAWDPSVGDLVIAEGAHYYGAACRFTGRILKDSRDAAGRHLAIRLHGTDHEPLLTWATGASAPARVHLCPEGCSRESEGPGLLHCNDLRSIKSLEELVGVPWRDVLLEGRPKAEDELAGLRSRMDGIGGPSPGAVAAVAEIEEKEKKEKAEKEKKKSKKKKKKKRKRGRSSRSRSEGSKKEKERKKKADGGRSPVSSSSTTSSSSTVEFKAVSQEELFRGSGLDPNIKTRRKQRRRAQRLARRSHHQKDESKSASSDDGRELGLKGDQVFGEPQRIRAIALQYPGVLSAQAIDQMQDLLVQELGQDRHREGQWSATYLRYFRQTLFRKMSGPMCREAQTLATIGDQLLKGLVPGALDTLTQRLKSLEAQSTGLAWTSSQRMDLLPPDGASLSSRQELTIAASEHRAEVKAHQAGAWKEWNKGKGGKAEKDDGAKGKGKKGKTKPKKD